MRLLRRMMKKENIFIKTQKIILVSNDFFLKKKNRLGEFENIY